MADQTSGKFPQFGMGTGILIAFVIIMLMGSAMIAWFSKELLKFVYIVPVIFLFLAIAAFLLILLHYAVVLQRFEPRPPVTALGLPEGSIRAFIAIGLLALVAVYGAFIYFESKGGTYPEAGIITATNLDQVKQALGDKFILIQRESPPNTYTVVSTTLDTSRSDLAKQLLTMITTLLTTVVGFYFGSRSGEAGTSGDLERRATALQAINAAVQKNRPLANELRRRLNDLDPQVASVDQAKQADVSKALGELRAKVEQADKDLEAAAATAAQASAKTDEIDATREKAVDAGVSLEAVKAKLDAAANLADLKPDAG